MTDWQSLSVDYASSIPACDFLASSIQSPALAQALGSASYRLKNGESTLLDLPAGGPKDLVEVAKYLHLCRLESIRGNVRASWLNPHNMGHRTDLIVWTNAFRQMPLFRQVPELHPHPVSMQKKSSHLKRSLTESSGEIRTLLCQSNSDLTALCEAIVGPTNPFAIVVDFTAFGRSDNVEELIEHVGNYFPSVPVMMLKNLGNLSLNEQLPNLTQHAHYWPQGRLNDTPISSARSCKGSIEVTQLPDRRLGDRLVNVMGKLRELSTELVNPPHKKKNLSPLYQVVRTLRNLVIPIEDMEHQLEHFRQGGFCPVRPLSDTLSLMTPSSMPTGLARQLVEGIVDDLGELLDHLSEGTTGKEQALKKWLHETQGNRLIICTSSREARYLRAHLLSQYPTDITEGTLTVAGASSVTDLYKAFTNTTYSELLIVGDLWDDTRWLLHTPAHITWLAYDFEFPWAERSAARASLDLHYSDEHRVDWWALAPVSYWKNSHREANITCTIWTACAGQYTTHYEFNIDLPTDPDWLTTLFEDSRIKPIDQPEDSSLNLEVLGDSIAIVTAEGIRHYYHHQQPMHVMRNEAGEEKLLHIACEEVAEGDYLVGVDMGDGRGESLIEHITDYIVESADEYQLYQNQVNYWLDLVGTAIRRLGSHDAVASAVTRSMSGATSVSADSVRRWAARQVIGPKKKHRDHTVPAIMKAAGLTPVPTDIALITKAQSKITGLHSNAGRKLRELIRAQVADSKTISGNLAQSVDEQLLREMVTVDEVASIHRIDQEPPNPCGQETLTSLVEQCVKDSQGRLSLTNAGRKSTSESPFKDLKKSRTLLNLMSQKLYSVYESKKSMLLDEVVRELERHQISFKGDTSTITKGRFSKDYYRQYDGRRVDIGKHLGIGNSGDPSRCLRVYFHWDDAQQTIVIHHFGKHLPTAS